MTAGEKKKKIIRVLAPVAWKSSTCLTILLASFAKKN